ncbi:MAG: hypothetical protein C5S48_10210 [Candidatus Methanogaster sp.]|nr:MAG: hypothetical protein C5S48_10210 [ANME-2 cluster archaeon]
MFYRLLMYSEVGVFGTTGCGKMFKYDGCDVAITHISAEHDARCNMNTKKLIGTSIIALLVVALSVGMAAAKPCTVTIADHPIINPLDGSTVTTSTTAIADYDPGDGTTRYLSVTTEHSDLHIRVNGTVNGTDVDTGWGNTARAGTSYTIDSTYPDSQLTVWVYGGTSGDVRVEDNAGTTYNTAAGYDYAVCTTQVDIPEFATIAIPMIALLGLVLYMRRKKD